MRGGPGHMHVIIIHAHCCSCSLVTITAVFPMLQSLLAMVKVGDAHFSTV